MNRTQAKTITHQRDISGYGRLVRRVNRILMTRRAQYERQANLSPSPDDHPEDWQRLLDEMQEQDGASVTLRPDGSVYVCWGSISRQ